jgi:hypothetical protein
MTHAADSLQAGRMSQLSRTRPGEVAMPITNCSEKTDSVIIWTRGIHQQLTHLTTSHYPLMHLHENIWHVEKTFLT